MTLSKINITEGTGDKKLATHSISEGGDIKEIQRITQSDSAGNEIGSATNPQRIAGTVVEGDDDDGLPGIPIAAIYTSLAPTLTDGKNAKLRLNAAGALLMALAANIAGEDLTNDVLKVEERYLNSRLDVQGQAAAAAGFIKEISVSPIVTAPTAGLLTIYDSLTETGTVLHKEWIRADVIAHTIKLNKAFTTGLYIGFDGSLANVEILTVYRLNN